MLALRYVDDLSVEEIATAMGRSVHATESLLVRARRALASNQAEERRMSQHPISVAFESIDADMSPVFQAQLRAGFLAAVSQPEVKEDAMVKVVDIGVGHRGNVVGPDAAVNQARPATDE